MPSTENSKFSFEEIKQEFFKSWPEVKDILAGGNEDNFGEESGKRLLDTLEYNVQNGKMLRGILTISSFMNFSNKSLQDKEMEGAYLLGWAIEILQGACLVADDIMDKSETRRGKPCWYKLPNVGMHAVKDAFMLNHASYKILDHAFFKTNYYEPLLALFCDICFKTTVGQNMDAQTRDIEVYSLKRYEKLVKYKTSYYTFVAPVLAGQILAGEESDFSKEDKNLLESALIELGLLFQVQDDMLDVFGDPEVTGKVGTDIQDRKCTWLLATYLETVADPDVDTMKNLFEDPETNQQKIKKLYLEYGMENKFEYFLEEKTAHITEICSGLANLEMKKMVLGLLGIINLRKF